MRETGQCSVGRRELLLGFSSGKCTCVMQVMGILVPGMWGLKHPQLLNRAQLTPFGTHLALDLHPGAASPASHSPPSAEDPGALTTPSTGLWEGPQDKPAEC